MYIFPYIHNGFFLTVIFFRSDIRYYMQHVVVKPRKYSLLLMIGRMMHSTSCTELDFFPDFILILKQDLLTMHMHIKLLLYRIQLLLYLARVR